jgi:hypothetical protein
VAGRRSAVYSTVVSRDEDNQIAILGIGQWIHHSKRPHRAERLGFLGHSFVSLQEPLGSRGPYARLQSESCHCYPPQ